jgi:hypothetical protein
LDGESEAEPFKGGRQWLVIIGEAVYKCCGVVKKSLMEFLNINIFTDVVEWDGYRM